MECYVVYEDYKIRIIRNSYLVYSKRGAPEKYLHKKIHKEYFSLESFKIIVESILEEFKRLLLEWKSQSAHLSSPTAMAMLPSYQKIISMGEPVIPLILEELKADPDHLFIALRAISGIDPVPPEHKGRIDKMAEAWINWGTQKNKFINEYN